MFAVVRVFTRSADLRTTGGSLVDRAGRRNACRFRPGLSECGPWPFCQLTPGDGLL